MYLILAISSVRIDSKLSLMILKNQINFNAERMNGIYKNIEEVINNEKVRLSLCIYSYLRYLGKSNS